MFILKWGGELTALGEAQAEYLGAKFRNSLYPGDEVGGGVPRLHSTYRRRAGGLLLRQRGRRRAADCRIRALPSGTPSVNEGLVKLDEGSLEGALLRHDLKIYSSDEGRVQTTAAAFTKGFLDLEGALPPILASLVSKDKSATAMLDDTNEQGRLGMDRSKAGLSPAAQQRGNDSLLTPKNEAQRRFFSPLLTD